MHRARNIQEAGMAINFQINGRAARSDAPRATPLLWVIREELKLTGTKFGCGTGLCGACMVHVDDKRAFSCLTQIGEVAGRRVTTIEGLSADSSHPVQKAWLAERVPQCGYCQSGQIMSAADLLAQNPHPDRAQILEHMSTNICRCGTYPRIVRAIERAAKEA
jgi:isoquinoline 1-oxidoreductase alpha subunit